MRWETTERGGLQKLCLAFPVASWGPMNARSPSQGWGWGQPACFHFAVCFLFRSTAQFWFGLLRADGLWQVRISGATHLCLLQGCRISSCQPLREQEVQPALLFCQPLSFHFSLFSFPLFFHPLSFCIYFLSYPLTPSLSPFLSFLLEFVLISFLPPCASFIQ